MAKQVQFRRGTTTEHGSFTGAAGEITFDTTLKHFVLDDGSRLAALDLLVLRNCPVFSSSYCWNRTAGGGNFSSDVTLNLDNSGVTAGTYGSATQVAQITVDAYGRVTAASNVAIQAGGLLESALALRWL